MQIADLTPELEELHGVMARIYELSNSLTRAIADGKRKTRQISSYVATAVVQEVPTKEVSTPEQVLETAKNIYDLRRKRNSWLPSELFGEPAWDILLELFIMRLQKQPVRVKSACIASGVPATTALRWINTLEKMGMIVSTADAADHRVRWLHMQDDAFNAVFGLLAEETARVRPPSNDVIDFETATSKFGGIR